MSWIFTNIFALFQIRSNIYSLAMKIFDYIFGFNFRRRCTDLEGIHSKQFIFSSGKWGSEIVLIAKYRVSQKTWEFSVELDFVYVMNQHCNA